MEGEVASGMEKAKEEVKDELREEMQKREENRENLVVYGLKESEEDDEMKQKDEDVTVVMRMATEIGVEFKGEVKSIYRAGKKIGDRPRPLVVKIEDDETREGILANARKMAGKDDWKTLRVSRLDVEKEEMRKEEKKLKEDAENRTEEENTAGKVGK